jgi:hypothetical protein
MVWGRQKRNIRGNEHPIKVMLPIAGRLCWRANRRPLPSWYGIECTQGTQGGRRSLNRLEEVQKGDDLFICYCL